MTNEKDKFYYKWY